MPKATGCVLRFKYAWLLIGYLLIALVVQQTLTPSPVPVAKHFSDKFLHMLGYFILMGWFVQIYQHAWAKMLWASFFLLMGVTLEFIQGWSGLRHYEVYDMLADGLGVIIAWLLSFTGFSRWLFFVEKIITTTR